MSQLDKLIRGLVTDTGLQITFSGMVERGSVTAEIKSLVKPNRRDTAAMATAGSAENALALAAAQGLAAIHCQIQLGFISLTKVDPGETEGQHE